MQYRFTLLATALTLTIAACDNGNQLSTQISTDTVGSGDEGPIETIDFFGMEQANSETIAYEPELGFALPARGTLSVNTAVIGSTTQGTDYRIDCPQGQVLAGIEGFATGNRVNQISALCVTTEASGAWIDSPQVQDSPIGITSGEPFNLVCENGYGLTGITGFTQNEAVASLKTHCSKLVTEITTQGSASDSVRVGDTNKLVANQLCGAGAVATGVHGRTDNELRSLGLVCNESPATAGRWSNPFNWPVQAVHAIMTPQGKVMTYGFGSGSTRQNASQFDYDIWDPALGMGDDAHNTFASDLGVWSFCNASIVLPESGNILMPGGTKLNSDNAGLADVPIVNTQTETLSRAADMANRRWYPSTVTLPNGEILVAGGRDVAGVPTTTPEVYSPATDEWRSLFGANMLGLSWTYPRLWVAKDGRVFGISGKQMYYISTEGSGFIEKVGKLPDQLSASSAGTALMYAPGKILNFGGNYANGVVAFTVDINGESPQVRAVDAMGLARSAWANSQVLADGTVMGIGGSRIVNDAVTASLNAELWDPVTEEWTVLSSSKWPRLYHSNSVLLKDATVVISGGGNPGPVTNYNAEIFTPPYLFNADGTPALRPQITWASETAAYGQEITVNTDSADIAKVTFIKTTAVTHSFNVEQRYMELPFSAEGTSLKVQIPADPTTATPGHYMMFVFNQNGTPSEATMVKLGSEPATEPPVVVVDPEPVDVNNLLANGGFEQGTQDWFACSDPALSAESNNANRGEKSLLQNSGACLYQEISVQPGATYTMSCDAYAQNSAYSSVSFNMLDNTYTPLATKSEIVTADSYTAYQAQLLAPQGSAFAAVTLYSEGPTFYDSCQITAGNIAPPEPPAPPPPVVPPEPPVSNLLANSDFAAGKESWIDCASNQLSTVVADAASNNNILQVENAGCIYQEFPVTEGKQYKLQCSASSQGTQYSSITFQMADQNYTQLDAKVSVIGPGQLQTYDSTLTAPANSRTSAITVYSEDVLQVDACYVEEI